MVSESSWTCFGSSSPVGLLFDQPGHLKHAVMDERKTSSGVWSMIIELCHIGPRTLQGPTKSMKIPFFSLLEIILSV